MEEEKPAEPLTVSELLKLRRQLAEDRRTELLDKLDEQLREMSENEGDRAAEMFQALADSGIYEHRETAAVNVGHLFATRSDRAVSILRSLLRDPDEQIRRKAFDTLDTVVEGSTITTEVAAQLAQAYYAADQPGQRQDPGAMKM